MVAVLVDVVVVAVLVMVLIDVVVIVAVVVMVPIDVVVVVAMVVMVFIDVVVFVVVVAAAAAEVVNRRGERKAGDSGNSYSRGSSEGCCCLLVGCLTSQQHASVSQGRICSDNFTCCYTEIEVADQTFYLTRSQYTDAGPTSPSADSVTPGAWQGTHWSASF